jgi:hypothetical protein
MLKMCESCEHMGLRRIDIGTGIAFYERRLMNASISVAEGSVDGPSCRRLVRWGLRALKPFVAFVPKQTRRFRNT